MRFNSTGYLIRTDIQLNKIITDSAKKTEVTIRYSEGLFMLNDWSQNEANSYAVYEHYFIV